MNPSGWMLMRSFGHDPSVLQKKLERDTVRRVFTYAKKYRAKLTVFVVAIVADSIVAVAPPLLLKELLGTAIPKGDRGLVMWIAAAAVGLALADAALNVLQRWLSAEVGEGLIFDLRTGLYDHVQRMPIAFFTRTQTGALISRMNNDVVGAQRAITSTLSSILSNAITVVTTLVVMFFLSWEVTSVALLVVPIFVLSARWVGKRLRVVNLESMNLNSSMNTMMTERLNVAGAMLVKLFGRMPRESYEFESRAARVRDVGVVSAVYTRTFMVALSLVAALATAGLYWIGGMAAISGTMQAATIAALGMYLAQLYSPLTALTTARVDYLTAMQSFERCFEVLDLEQTIKDKPGAVAIEDVRGSVEYDHVSFHYPSGAGVVLESLQDPTVHGVDSDVTKPVLHDVSFTIEPGQMVALVGPSGAGKTTIAQLLARMYDVTDGAVRIDGHDIRDVTLESLTGSIGVVTQDPHLFHESIGGNLRFAKPGATDAELATVCRMANIHEVVDALPDGYDTMVGERGYRLSGGEKQRLAIARMLLKDPRIVVLDEATSHLDSENEALIQRALDAALAGRSSLVIAHRLSTIKAADRILVVDGGRVVEVGRHDELLAAGGLYAELYETQFGDRVEADSEPGEAADAVDLATR